MDDEQVLSRIDELVKEEEHPLHRHESEPLSDEERARLQEVEARLDSAWDFLRQRRSLRQYGMDPDDAAPRDPDTVESYGGLSPRRGGLPPNAATLRPSGALAEWLRSGLQSLLFSVHFLPL